MSPPILPNASSLNHSSLNHSSLNHSSLNHSPSSHSPAMPSSEAGSPVSTSSDTRDNLCSNTQPNTQPSTRPEVAIAILQQEQQFLLQLRDNVPGILYPGYWGFFGGHLEPGENAIAAIQRELLEEIAYSPTKFTLFRSYTGDPQVIRHVYHVPLTVELEQLHLNEGWDMGLFTIDEIRRGSRYSERAGQIRPLGTPHQRILLDFLESSSFISSMS